MTIYGYTRVSTLDQAQEGVSLAAQRSALEARGVEAIFEDAGVTSGIPLEQRPAGSELAAKLQAGDVLVAAKLDRLFRSSVECLIQVDKWRIQGVEVVLLDVGLDTSTPMGRAVLTIMAALAQLERDQIRARTKDAMAHLKIIGAKVGRAPFGYRYAEEPGGDGRKALEEAPHEMETLDRALALRSGGLSFSATAVTLNQEERLTRSGKVWSPRNLANVLSSHAQTPET
jgi:DNA invertase Pin-like site-specific DNA recombinase